MLRIILRDRAASNVEAFSSYDVPEDATVAVRPQAPDAATRRPAGALPLNVAKDGRRKWVGTVTASPRRISWRPSPKVY